MNNKTVLRVKKSPNEEANKKPPYEVSHTLEKLLLCITVVNDGQAASIVSLANDSESAVSFICHGVGTARNDVYDVLGFGESRKQVVMSLVKESLWSHFKELIQKRFSISAFSKGVSFAIGIDSLCGVSAYKLISNRRSDKINKGEIPMEEIDKKKDYEVVFAIVNDGYTDLVMEAAKRAGARGGTVIVAHGTGNKDIEKFFGVVITPEKQIVMILVPKAIKDAVISNIYKDVNINSKGQGICFSVPAVDVVGVSSEETTPDKPLEADNK